MALGLPKRIPIRVRTAAALAIPLVMLLVVAGIEVTRSGRERAEVREQTDLATASIGPAGAINALMNERNYTSLWMFGVEGTIELHVEDAEDARRQTDESLAAFEAEVRRKGGRAERLYSPAIEALDVLDDIRADVDGYDGVRNPLADSEVGDGVWETYNRLVTGLADATTELAYEIEDPQLRRGVQLIDLAARQVDRISRLVRFATIEAVRTGGPITDPADFSLGVQRLAEADRRHQEILDHVDGPYAHLRQPLDEESEATGIFDVGDRFVETGVVDVAGLLRSVSIAEGESYYGFIHDASDVIRARADHLNDAAQAERRTILALAGLVLLGAVAAALLVARSITQPLESLTRQAREMADRRLPEAVRRVHELPLGEDVVVPELESVSVASRDEVADVAEQLNAVQTAALDLAVEQAVLRRNFADVFVNLCRRIQGLLGRQLDLVAEFGTTEARPHRALGSRWPPDLTEVSRCAVRLRRHAESLLVLADVDPRPERSGEATPLPDVVDTALAEISDTGRVRVVALEPVVLAGPLVADVAHLLAELVEGALRTILPDEWITITGTFDPVTGDYTIGVADPGSGVTQGEVARANRRLAGEEEPTTAPSKHLAQYVAAKLAARHGLSVALRGSVASGITATVHLPAALLAPVPAPEPGPGPDSGDPAPERSASEARGVEPEPIAAEASGDPAAECDASEPPAREGEVTADPASGDPAVEPEPVAAEVSEGPSSGAPAVEPEPVAAEASGYPASEEPVGAEAAEDADTGDEPAAGNDPHPSGPNPAAGPLCEGDEPNLDVYGLLADFPTGEVERPALATPTARRDADPPQPA